MSKHINLYVNVILAVFIIIFYDVCKVASEDYKLSTSHKPENIYSPSPYNLEDYCLGSDGRGEVYIDSWKGAIFQLGFITNNDGSPKSRTIHHCKINIRTNDQFWLVAAIEHMRVRGKRDVHNKWRCSDYIKFISPGRHLVGKILGVLALDEISDIFSAKKSEELCGDKTLDAEHADYIVDLSTDANSFSTASNEMSLILHQDNDERHSTNNTLKVVITTFRHASEQVECEDKQKCYGRDIYCIDKRFICDGHVNCAFPGSGTDEKLCEGDKKPEIFNMTSVIVISLTSVVTFGILICIITTLVCRIKAHKKLSQADRQRRELEDFDLDFHNEPATAPDYNEEPESALPTYDTVIVLDESADKGTLESEMELPPKYESLFPNGASVRKTEGKES